MTFQKNQKIQLEITDLGNEGEGIGKIDGFPFFVKDTVVGDHVTATVMKVRKNFGFARLVSVENASEDREDALCPVARPCGGCQLQHMSYEAELRFKQKKVHDCLLRIGGIPEKILSEAEEPIVGMEKPWRYRNKAQYPIGVNAEGRTVAGFYAGRTHSIIESDNCALTPPEFQKILRAVLGFIEEHHIRPYDEKTGKGLVRHVLIRKGFATGEIMLCLVCTSAKFPHRDEFVQEMKNIPGMTSICININAEKTNVILGKEIEVLYGQGYITDILGGLKFQIGPLSFYQVNPVQAERLYMKAMEYAGLTEDGAILEGGRQIRDVWDICCGIGTITLFAADTIRKLQEKLPDDQKNALSEVKIHGLEIVPEAIEDAKINAKLNDISNAEFAAAAAEDYMPEYLKANPDARADVIIVDPPRKGLDPEVLRAAVEMQPSRFVYVSCDPATLARDLKIMLAAGYKLRKFRAYDQFSRTSHTEAVALLTK
ncbi:23S rRNA (uracil1939-C5)-methyltransferase [Lachnospiraceae bacterium]|nr:23S rRNA (uracil1939-C5)-methyltransferase [Lachnospiraceae bacterium]